MRTINQDTAIHFCLFSSKKYARIVKEAQKVKAQAEKKNEKINVAFQK